MVEQEFAKRLSAFLIGALLSFAAPVYSKTPSIIFDPPNSGQTNPVTINDASDIAGDYFDSGSAQYRGFVRAADGTITTFAPPDSTAIFVFGMNNSDTITGMWLDGGYVAHGFVRTADGTITSFDAPGILTQATAISDKGLVAGFYEDNSGQTHGFLRSLRGNITTFDAPGQGFLGTVPVSINAGGVIAGWWGDTANVRHGFVREHDGTITSFDPDDATQTSVSSINIHGELAGYFSGPSFPGFVRSAKGEITSFAPADSKSTTALSINRDGRVTGYYLDSKSVARGFVYTSRGAIRTFRVHGAGHKRYQGSFPASINDNGAITGYLIGNDDRYHGFMQTR